MPPSCDDHQDDAIAYLSYRSSCHSEDEAMGAWRINMDFLLNHGQPMFTVKPANDTEEFYEVVKKYKYLQLNGTF